ncbi:ABC transporter substrate-binding protein [Desulfospira joergensenii]|uniref:ABC transporter substrate-binding protein n=1 Tax=Desulfospira joergensenii TaxID=53329 RepID=UPI0004233DE8|nr:sugar ABC transporter substrate-binding protein [Desulfospira joergensenii]
MEFSYPPFGYSAAAEKAFWGKHIKAFETENPGIKMNMTWESWGNIFQKTSAAVESGKVPDISYNSPPQIMPLAKQGHIMPVDDVIADLGGVGAFQEALIKQYVLDQKTYCVPNADANLVMCYRKDLLKAAGYDHPPKTWDELVKISLATTRDGVYGLGLYLGKTYDTRQVYAGMMWAAGGSMLDEEGNVALNSPENLTALKFYTDLYLKHKVVPQGAVAWKYGDNANIIGAGQVAMTPMWGGYGTLIQEMFPDNYKNIGFAPLPAGPTGHSGSWSGVGGFYVFAKARHPEEAKKFIKFMSKPEIQKEWCLISGNVSPFKAIAQDPDLTKFDWYRAIAEQSASSVQTGWLSSAAVPGLEIIGGQHVLAEPVEDVISNGMTPEAALKKAHDHMAQIIEKAKSH